MRTETFELVEKTFNPQGDAGYFKLVGAESNTEHKVNFSLKGVGSQDNPQFVVVVTLESDDRQSIIGDPIEIGTTYGWTDHTGASVYADPIVKDETFEAFLGQMLNATQHLIKEHREEYLTVIKH